jgi:hypothetical protein
MHLLKLDGHGNPVLTLGIWYVLVTQLPVRSVTLKEKSVRGFGRSNEALTRIVIVKLEMRESTPSQTSKIQWILRDRHFHNRHGKGHRPGPSQSVSS